MAGTRAGGLKAKQSNIERYGEDYYQKLGKRSAGKPKKNTYLSLHPEFASKIGKIGGARSKRRPSKQQ